MDVYGVPFEVIPVKKKPLSRTEVQKVSTLVRALPERRHLEITFPRVEGYVFDVRQRVRANLESVPYLAIDPGQEPTEVVAKPAAGSRIGRPDRMGPGPEVIQDRNPFHREKRLQATVYEIASALTRRLKARREEWSARHLLFPQVLEIVWRYVEERIVFAVPAHAPGVETYTMTPVGPRMIPFGGLRLKGVSLPESHLVAGEGRGFKALLEGFNYSRLLTAMEAIGAARAAIDEAIHYTKERQAFGRPLAKFEAVQFRIAEDLTLLEAARLLCLKALRLRDRGLSFVKEAAMAKWFATEGAFRAVNDAIQNMGAYGFTVEKSPNEARLRWVRGLLIGDGTPDIMKIIIAREVLGRDYVPYR